MKVIKNEKSAEIVGLCFGDGSLTRRHSGKNKGKLRFQMRGNITEDREHYDNYIKPLFDEIIAEIPTTRYNGKKPYYGISTESSKICNYLVSLGVPVGIKKELRTPEWILEDKNLMKSFLRGIFDTDGSVFCRKDYNYLEKGYTKIRIMFGSTSENLILSISKILESLEIKHLVIKPYIQKTRNWANLNRIQIDNLNVIKYFNLVGSNNPKHITKFEVWKRFGICPPRTTIEQRYSMLQESAKVLSAGVSEPGQMNTVEVTGQKPYTLVVARVQIPSPAYNIQ